MKYDAAFFDNVLPRRGTRSVKWDAAVMIHSAEDLPMWVADWDFQCAEPIVEAIKARAEHPCYGYNCSDANDAAAFCGFWQRRHHLTIQPEQTCMLPCVVTGLRLSVRCFAPVGGKVMILTPVYGPFKSAIDMNGRVCVAVPLLRDETGRYSMDFAAIEKEFQQGVSCLLMCNPHNPVSRAWHREELQKLLDLCRAYGVILVSDEIHADFVYQPQQFIPMLSLEGAQDCVIALASASKTFNVPGLQQSMAVSFRPDLLEKIHQEAECAGVTTGNTFALAATQKAYTECDDWLDALREYLDDSRKLLKDELARLLPKAILTPIEATCLAWIDLRAYAASSDEIDEKLRAQHVVLNRGTMFDETLGNGFVRLNFACPHALLLEGLQRIAAALNA